MATLVHRSLTNSQAVALPAQFATPWQPGLIAGGSATLRVCGDAASVSATNWRGWAIASCTI